MRLITKLLVLASVVTVALASQTILLNNQCTNIFQPCVDDFNCCEGLSCAKDPTEPLGNCLPTPGKCGAEGAQCSTALPINTCCEDLVCSGVVGRYRFMRFFIELLALPSAASLTSASLLLERDCAQIWVPCNPDASDCCEGLSCITPPGLPGHPVSNWPTPGTCGVAGAQCTTAIPGSCWSHLLLERRGNRTAWLPGLIADGPAPHTEALPDVQTVRGRKADPL
ncbi:hypothetical protein GYMLUDRAFT_249794 [Collybiopsis luxurians FD-317 M1]|uniref:Uncharacterized protein n=1 Tax=Collybiopsis luxurians FD-317 M1 TaxID=944289 RepID=A0A0D0BWT4_9AGAR|nr:hypothetical protein GYMLUDRAFT_249794 [Collybiopsis luxurians FD-317 M1]